MSTAAQLAGTLNRFFKDDPKVVLLKMDYSRLSGFKIVKWEPSGSGESASLPSLPHPPCARTTRSSADASPPPPSLSAVFPHLYAQLEGENVEEHRDLEKKPGETSWDAALERARRAGWLKD